jgi:hypothetical protein
MRFRKTLTVPMRAMALVFALSAWAQQKPFTQDQVSNLVRDRFGDESGGKLIEQRGIDFAPADDFLQSLKTAGPSEAFLKALRTGKATPQRSSKETARPGAGCCSVGGSSSEPPRRDAGERARPRLRTA